METRIYNFLLKAIYCLLLFCGLPFLLNAEMAYKEWLDTCRRQFEAKRKEARLDEKRTMERINEQMNTFIPVLDIISKKLGFKPEEKNSGINPFYYENELTLRLCYSIVLCRAKILSIDEIKKIEIKINDWNRIEADITCTAEILEVYWGNNQLDKAKQLNKLRFGLKILKWRTRTQGMIDSTPCINDEIILPLHHYEKDRRLFFALTYDLIVNSEKGGRILKCKDITCFDKETPLDKIEKIIKDIKLTGNEFRIKEGLKPL